MKTRVLIYLTNIPGPSGPEMLALWQAFRANLFQTNEPTRHFMYIDERVLNKSIKISISWGKRKKPRNNFEGPIFFQFSKKLDQERFL